MSMYFISKIFTLFFTVIFLVFGSGLTICKMVCLESGDVQIALNEEGACCEEDTEEDACCEDEENAGCCTHEDNQLALDNYVVSSKTVVDEASPEINSLFVFNTFAIIDNELVIAVKDKSPPPLPVEDVSTYTHLLRI